MAGPWEKYSAVATEEPAGPWAKYLDSPASPPVNTSGLANQALRGTGIQIRAPQPPPVDMQPYGGKVTQTLDAAGARLADLGSSGWDAVKHGMLGRGGLVAYPPELQKQLDTLPQPQEMSFKDPANVARQKMIDAYYVAHPEAENPMPGLSQQASENSPIAVERLASGDTPGGLGETITNLALMKQGARAAKTPGIVPIPTPAEGIRSAVGPKVVRIEGVDMPVLTGEAPDVPTTGPEKLQVGLKRAGAAPDEFTKIEAQQQAAVKQVIRNVVQKNSGLIGPLPESPVGAVMQGAEANFEQARPIYQALDASLTHVPTIVDDLGALTQKAVGRLRNKGIEIGNTYNPSQPLQSAMQIRSELLDMQRAARNSGDTLKAKVAGDEASALDGDIHSTLSQKPPLLASWRQANALWKRGIALRDVADAIDSTVKGTPVETQVNIPGQIGARPTEINAAGMVEKFNDLAKDGVLDKAFGEGYSRSIRQTVEFLKRAQETNIGNRTMRMSGYSPRSAVGHSVVDFFYRLGGGQIAKLMTNTQGAKMVANLTGATTPEQVVARSAAIQNRLASGQYEAPASNYQQKTLPGQKALPPAGSVQTPTPPPRLSLPAPNTVRLYRGESVPGSGAGLPDWVKNNRQTVPKAMSSAAAEGRWFTTDLSEAQKYAEEAGTGRITYVDVPAAEVEKYRAANNPEAAQFVHNTKRGSINDEHFVSPELAKQARPLEPVYEGEYVESPTPNGPKMARPQPPPGGPTAMPSVPRQSLPLPRQQALPPARSTQLANVSDSTAKLISRTRGYTNVVDVMEAAKNGVITPAEAARITKLLKGRAAEITRPLVPPQ